MDKQKMVRDYFAENIHITTSGHYSTRMLQAAMAELGADRIQFAIDYPYEDDLKNGSDWIDSCPISEPDRVKIARNNAVKLLRLDQAPWNMSLDASRKELEIGGMTSHVWGYGLSQH
jgi:2,3-dihydroxybenzoate decarboxylase